MSFKSVLKSAFPFITTAAQLGGPLAVMAANAVGGAIGIDKVDPSPGGIEAAITQAQIKDPDALLKLEEAERGFQVQMQKLGFENVEKLAAIDAEDRASARAREIALKDRLPAILSIGVTLGFFTLLALLAFRTIPDTSREIVVAMTGTLGTAWIGIVNYYFGSSAGSARKSDTISNIAQGKQ